MAQRCPNIQDIWIGWTNITNQGLTALALGCPNIQMISLQYTKITDQGLTTLLQKCPNIKRINLTRCDAITDTGLNYLADWYPDIQKC